MSIAQLMRTAAGVGGGLDVADVFKANAYSGNNSTQDLSGPDMTGGGLGILKRRDSTGDWGWFDTERGATVMMSSNTNGAEVTDSDTLTSFNSDGVTIGADVKFNALGSTDVAHLFAIAARFVDVVDYIGDGTAGRTIAHNLGETPGMIIVKRRSGTANWFVYHRGYVSASGVLNSPSGFIANAMGAVTDTDFTTGSFVDAWNTGGQEYVAYLFAHDTEGDGIIQCGSYTGNGSATGPTITLGWEPQYVMIKRADSTGDWWIYDAARDASNPRTYKLLANSSAAEDTAGEDVDFTSTGFQPKTTATGINASGGTYVFMAIRAEDA